MPAPWFPSPPAKPACIPKMAGFTLLEIMVAMLLLTIIITSSVSLLFLNVRGWDGLMADSEQMLDEILIGDRINIALGRLVPLKRVVNGRQRLVFAGEAQSVHFVSPAPRQFLAGGLFEYLLMVEKSPENGSDLVLYYAPYLPDGTAFSLPSEGEKRILMPNMERLGFSFYGKKGRRDSLEWSNSWAPESENYPEIIKMSLQSDEQKRSIQTGFIRILTTHSSDSGRSVWCCR